MLLFLLACVSPDPKDSSEPVLDHDQDGILSTTDCDDNDASIGLPTPWYGDGDQDGYGVSSLTQNACTAPSGFVDNPDDCDDGDANIHPGADEFCNEEDDNCNGVLDDDPVDVSSFYTDADADGYGDPASVSQHCNNPGNQVEQGGDCNDTLATVSPDATELCNGMDDDCDGSTDENDAADASIFYADVDGDGYGDASAPLTACAAPPGYGVDDSDCADNDATSNPQQLEFCNGKDDNCDGSVDEDSAEDAIFWYLDADGDSFGDAATGVRACAAPTGTVADATDCNDGDPIISPVATEFCNLIDDDCDGTVDENDAADAPIWYADTDGDNFGDPAQSQPACLAPTGFLADHSDCNDQVATAFPGATEFCNQIDDDCDGTTDENDAADAQRWYDDADGDGVGALSSGSLACNAPSGTVSSTGDCDDGNAQVRPGLPEHCDGVDEDCDGMIDQNPVDGSRWYADGDGDGLGDPAVSQSACSTPAGFVADFSDCDDAHAFGPEVCDGVDNDCDGTVDGALAADATDWYADGDGDGHGDPATAVQDCTAPIGFVAAGDDCDDGDSSLAPGLPEHCDGLDEDCDGVVDNSAVDAATWYADSDGDGYGDATTAIVDCSQPSGYVADATDCDDLDAAHNTSCAVGCSTINAYPGDVYASGFGTATSLSSFCGAYNAIDGDLTLDKTDLSSMAVLSCLCQVSGDLTITNNSALTTLTGLDKLGSVGGNVSIENNDKLPDYTGLNYLGSVLGTFVVGKDNALIKTFDGLDALTSVGTLKMESTPFTSMNGLDALTTVTSDLSISSNSSLTSISGLASLQSVGGTLKIYSDTSLSTLTGLENLQSVGTLSLYGNSSLSSLAALSNLSTLTGNLSIYYCNKLSTLSGLDGLSQIGGGLTIYGVSGLSSLTGLNQLTQVGSSVSVTGGSSLSSLSGLDALTQIGKDLTLDVSLSPTMSSLSGLGQLSVLGGSLTVTGNGTMGTSGLGPITSIPGDLIVSSVSSLSGLGSLTSISQGLSVSSVPSYSGLSALTYVGGSVGELNGSFTGLSALKQVDGAVSLVYSSGAELTSLTTVGYLNSRNANPDIPTLTTITGGASFSELTTLSGFNAVKTIGGGVSIQDSFYSFYPLADISGFKSLQSIGGYLSISYWGYLTKITGFSSLTDVTGAVTLYSDEALTDVSGFSKLARVGGLTVYSAYKLPNVNGFSALTTVNGPFSLSFNQLLTDVTALHHITSVNGDFSLLSNGINSTQAYALRDAIGTSHISGTISINE